MFLPDEVYKRALEGQPNHQNRQSIYVRANQGATFQSHLQRDVSSRGYVVKSKTWWRHQMETFSALLAICVGNSPVPGEFPAQRPVTQSFDVFFDLRLNKRLSKQSWGWWFKTLPRPLWRHSKRLFKMGTPDNTLHAFKQCRPTVQYLVFRNSSCFKWDVFYPGLPIPTNAIIGGHWPNGTPLSTASATTTRGIW